MMVGDYLYRIKGVGVIGERVMIEEIRPLKFLTDTEVTIAVFLRDMRNISLFIPLNKVGEYFKTVAEHRKSIINELL